MSKTTLMNPSRYRRLLSTPLSTRFSNIRFSSSFAHLEQELTSRRLPLIYDYLVPTPSHLLNLALSDVLPPSSTASLDTPPPPFPTTSSSPAPSILPPTHHLIYFPPAIPGRMLLADGTDPLQSPGDPFVRRMWAGGAVRFSNNPSSPSLTLNGARAVCLESIKDVSVKGNAGSEKVFVGIERRVGATLSESEDEDSIRARLYRDGEEDFADGAVGVIERRNIVFMRARTREQAARDMEAARTKQLKPPSDAPEVDCTVAPDAKMLFRFSALTYNAHAIHLDPKWCKEEEGHRGLLVHGPLSFTLMMTNLRLKLAQEGKGEAVASVEYRNLAPLYAGEPLRLCGRAIKRAEKGEAGKWEVWAETPEGGVAVKGTVRTELVSEVNGTLGDLDMIMGR